MDNILENDLKNFYQKEKKNLEKYYPGLSIKRLEQEFLTYAETSFGGKYNIFERFVKDIKKGIPLEYITEKAYFFRSEFYVNDSVLVPRSETEILVERATHEILNLRLNINESVRVVDVGVGSGAIILSLLQEANCPLTAYGVDISEDALKVTKINAYRLRYTYHQDSNLELAQGDRLTNLFHGIKFHMIVSNPPYIKKNSDSKRVHIQVKKYEPEVALYLNDDEYDEWYKIFFTQVDEKLLLGGTFLMEGHEDHLENLKALLKNFNFSHIEILKDYNDCDRFLLAKK